jgi:hypothetical protein
MGTQIIINTGHKRRKHKHGKCKPILTLSTIINNKTYIMADISLNTGESKNGKLTLLDAKSGNVLSATFSNQSIGTNSNPELASFVLDPNDANVVVGTGIAEGSGTVDISAHADYTDGGNNSSQSKDFSVTKNYTVTLVLTENGATLDVTFE